MAGSGFATRERGRHLNIKGVIADDRTGNVAAMRSVSINNIKIVNAASTDEQVRYEFDKS